MMREDSEPWHVTDSWTNSVFTLYTDDSGFRSVLHVAVKNVTGPSGRSFHKGLSVLYENGDITQRCHGLP